MFRKTSCNLLIRSLNRIAAMGAITLGSSLITPYVYATHGDSSRLLLIYSYHPSFVTSYSISQGLREPLKGLDIDIEIEFMDSKRLYSPESLVTFHQYLSFKMQNKEAYDYVVTSDDNALRYALEHQDTLFADTPIVFLGVNNKELAKQQNNNPLVTGIVEAASLSENVELGKELFPAADTIHVITDGTTSGQADMVQLESIKGEYPDLNWNSINLANLSWDEFSNSLSQLEANKAYGLLISAYRDKHNIAASFDDSLQVIVNNTKLPILHPYQHGMGEGVLGGIMVSHRHQGIEAGKIIAALEGGVSIQDLRVLEKSPNVPIFDVRELDEHFASKQGLPLNSDIRYRTPSFSERNSYEIIQALLVVLFASAFYLANRYMRAKELKASERKLRSILDSMDSFVYLKDEKGRYLFANEILRKQFGMTCNEVVGKTDFDLFGYETAKKIVAVDQQVIASKNKYYRDEHYWNEDEAIVKTTKIPLLDDNENVYALCGVSIDITQEMLRQKLLEQAAYYDSLTGLPNRLRFVERLTEAMTVTRNSDKTICMAFFDLDNFKVINEKFGHDVGDKVLKEVLNRVHKNLEKGKMEMARIGGDEFYLLGQCCSSTPEMFNHILDIVNQPVLVDGKCIALTVSAGVTSYPQIEEVEPEHLFRQAEQALYNAKHHGKNRIERFGYDGDGIQVAARKQELSRALTNNEFTLYFQPKVSLVTGEIVGVEALIRWLHPEQGILAPGAFLSDIESLGLIKELDDWVLDRALDQAQAWYKSGLNVPVSVNLSHVYFRQADIDQILSEKLAQYPRFPARMLEIEIVETSALENLESVADIIESCKKLDIRFSLDDFGTGYSSLTYLQQLPVHTLKVDKSFVINMLDNTKDMNIVQGILGFCKAFELTAVAEGVESIEHGLKLQEMGYDIAQGYGIARPMPVEELVYWVVQWQPPKEWGILPNKV